MDIQMLDNIEKKRNVNIIDYIACVWKCVHKHVWKTKSISKRKKNIEATLANFCLDKLNYVLQTWVQHVHNEIIKVIIKYFK